MGYRTCINCGAPIHGNVCEYCGTEYRQNGFTGDFGAYDGVITVNGQTFRCYIGEINIFNVCSTCTGRTKNGDLKRDVMAKKRKITLIEY